MLSKLSRRFRKNGTKILSPKVPAQLSSTNHSSTEMDPLEQLSTDCIRITTESQHDDAAYSMAYSTFLQEFPLYAQTHEVDELRSREFRRIEQSRAVYVDYMGACLYPDFLVREHMEMLTRQLVGNTHSDSPSSTLSEKHVSAARHAVLSFFDASPEDYVCIFTSNCTGALKVVGESFPFGESSRLVLAEDSHNSVNGIRKFAENRGSTVDYVPSMLGSGFNEADMMDALRKKVDSPSLLALTGQSNISGCRPNLPLILSAAKRSGYYTLLDAAALASTASISLSNSSSSTIHLDGNVDALAISFYKLFGYPTGVGALVARKDFLSKLRRPWFSGGTVEVVGFPCTVTESKVPWERFEEGTLSYAALAALPAGLDMLKGLISGPQPMLPSRLDVLHRRLHDALEGIKHANGTPVVKVLTSKRSPLTKNGSPTTTSGASQGYILSLTFHDSTGARIRNAEVSRRAAVAGISLRTGCACNPGGAVGLLGLRDDMVRMQEATKDASNLVLQYGEIEQFYGQEVGVVRISLGLVTNFRDIWEVKRFVKGFAL